VDAAILGSYNAQIALSKAMLDFNLAVSAYEISSDLGVASAIIR